MNISAILKELIQRESVILKCILTLYNHFPFNNKFRGKQLRINCSLIKNSKIAINGQNNLIEICKGTRLVGCNIYIIGSNNKVIIGDLTSAKELDIYIEDNDNEIIIGEHTSFEGKTHLACIEGSKIHIGNDCMFSANITIRTGDSHSIIDMEGKRINASRNVDIGEHVWIGNTVLITKGVVIPKNSIVGTGSVVTRHFDNGGIIIAGNPASIIKENISWKRERISL